MTVENLEIKVTTNAGDEASKINSLSSALRGVSGTAAKSASSGVRSVGTAAKHATKHTSQFASSLTRIAKYRLLRTVIKEITQAFSEGLKNAYNFSAGINGSLASALDSLSSKALTMKNQLGAAFGGLLETITPILLRIIELVRMAAQAISAFFAAIGGGQYLVANDVAQSWDNATGAAKKYRNTILGFDEINRLDEPSGGGGGSAVDASNMFHVEELPGWAQKIKDALGMENLREIGAELAKTINDWFSGINAEQIGKNIGEKIRSALGFAISFLRTIDLESIGSAIAQFFNGAISRVRFNDIGRLLVRRFTSAVDFLAGFIENLDASEIRNAISDFLTGVITEAQNWINSVDWKALANSASRIVANVIGSISDFLGNIDWNTLGKDIYNWFKNTLEGIDFGAIADSVMYLLGAALSSAVKLIAGFVEGVIKDIKDYFLKYIRDENGDGQFGGKEIIEGLFMGAIDAMRSVYEWVGEHIIKPFIKAVKDLFGIHSPSTVFYEIGENIVQGFVNGFSDAWNGLIGNITNDWSGLKQWFSSNPISVFGVNAGISRGGNFGGKGIGSFASGGTLENNGTLFLAGEAGPEIVANMGSQTGVMNVGQMEAAVANGNDKVVSAVYSMANAIVTAINNKDSDISIDGESVARLMYRPMQMENKRRGQNLVSGGVFA